ncbi:MAG TPA: hypothetical protein VNA69_11315 [Thermoanaerobaculia bacterium]|nr:hypothetical protein [Thermoanaerobaculia bacterium]
MIDSLRVLLEHLIDYAGLFPPASLTMQDAVRNYARYRDGKYAWALGRFVVPKERAHEVPPEFPLSVLGVDEVKAEELESAAPGAFVEITDTSLLPELKKRGLRAKIRTGGLTADAFPTPETIAAFLRACKAEGVAFKATAGLHHPLRCVKALTYEPDGPVGTMHGFINVFLAAAVVDRAEEILRETDARSFFFGDDGASWRGHHIGIDELATVRRTFALSFGSCSFEEPIADLKELEWL